MSAETSGTIDWADIEEGSMVGLWWKPDEGFTWRDDLHLFFGPEIEADEATRALAKVGPWLQLQGKGRIRYPVFKRPLVNAFRRLADTPTPERILRFAEQYGPLGSALQPVFEPGEDPRPMLHAESLHDWLAALTKFRALYEIWMNVQTVRSRASRGNESVRHAKEFLAARFRRERDSMFYQHDRHYDLLAHKVHYRPEIFEELLKRDPIVDDAGYYVHREINKVLRDQVHIALLPFRQGAIRFEPENLLAAIYVQFAREMAHELPIERECARHGCRNLVEVTRRDRIYCSHRCRQSANYRKKRDGLKAGAEVVVPQPKAPRQPTTAKRGLSSVNRAPKEAVVGS